MSDRLERYDIYYKRLLLCNYHLKKYTQNSLFYVLIQIKNPLHVAGFEPTLSNWKRIMSPLLSTTQPYMYKSENEGIKFNFMPSLRYCALKLEIHFK